MGLKIMGIRRAKKSDVNKIFQMINELENFSLDKNSFLKIFYNNLKNKQIFYVVSEHGGKTVGFISLHIQKLLHHAGKVAEIQELFVDSAMRGHGVGEKMIKYVKRIAQEENCDSLETTSNIKRKRSHKFYQNKAGLIRSHYKFTQKL